MYKLVELHMINCEICGKEITTNKPNRATCSRECKMIRKNNNWKLSYCKQQNTAKRYKCPDCGKMLSFEKYRYCRNCRERHLTYGVIDVVSMEHNLFY